ncbi:hypothetical protein EYF80_067964 [Liparis tanakae]|uniref:Uncharacterized protein n=1 Tax=Liparis tanakae TaxID=230148 RepID=A0A4Z2DZH2_9TELE|nr:hypothetical protein EYF80_067964 [Liparis tanakae]
MNVSELFLVGRSSVKRDSLHCALQWTRGVTQAERQQQQDFGVINEPVLKPTGPVTHRTGHPRYRPKLRSGVRVPRAPSDLLTGVQFYGYLQRPRWAGADPGPAVGSPCPQLIAEG